MIERLTCPNCGAHQFARNRQQHLVCNACGNVYRARTIACATCDAPNPSNALHCKQCGERLAHRCTACGHKNPAEAELCASCDTPLDVLEFISRRYAGDGTPDRQELLRAKSEGVDYMAVQSVRLHEVDRERRVALGVQKTEQMRQERLVLLAVVAGGALLLVVFVVAVLLGNS